MCGEIRYKVSGPALRVVNCHCDDCRKVTGAAFATNIAVRKEDLTITKGTPKTFSHFSDSGNEKIKDFCPTCGSQLFSSNVSSPTTMVKIGGIDDPSFAKPEVNIYCTRALPFTHISEDLANFDEMPVKRAP